MKRILIVIGVLIVAGVIYLNHRYGLLSLAGLNNAGLPVKEVSGSLEAPPSRLVANIDHTPWSSLLKKHVNASGLVDYRGFLQERGELKAYLDMLAGHVPAKEWPVHELLAYYINLYNARTVYLILEHYPLESIRDIDRPWTRDIVRIGDKELSLGALEHSILRKMDEPRIHFAINCASVSCPKLLNEAYTPEDVHAQLEQVTYEFINSGEQNTITPGKVELSRIFDWYKGDFADGDLRSYINEYARVPIPAGVKIGFKTYDWRLNSVPVVPSREAGK